MTSVPLDQLGANAGDDGLRRDGYGRLLVVPPQGGKPVGYSRVTTVAKATDDGGGLMPWKATCAVVGTLKQRGIRAKWETLVATHRDPWYAGEEPKAKCKALVEEAAEAGGAGDRREQGNMLHAVTALIDAQRPHHTMSDEIIADHAAYVETLDTYGIEIVEGMIETTVVLDEYRVGGTFDRLVTCPGFELPLIADLKTGADLSYSDGNFASQLAGYSRASAIYRQGEARDGSQDQRLPMPEVDQHIGIIIWLPAGERHCELFTVDLDAGWEGFNLAVSVRQWRSRKGLRTPLSVFKPAKPINRPSVEQVNGATLHLLDPLPAAPAETVDDVEAVLAGVQEIGPGWRSAPGELPTEAELRPWLQARIDAIGAFSDSARADLAAHWPGGLPPLKSSTEHTADQLAVIEQVLDDVEARHGMPFGPSRPGRSLTHEERVEARLMATFPNTTKDQPQ